MPSKPILLAVFLSCGLIVLITALGLPPGHSAPFNYAWTTQCSDAFGWSNPFPRYLPGLWAGLGGYDFFFYAPLPFWLIATIVDPVCRGCAPATEFVLGSAIILVASGLAMFAFLRSFFSTLAAIVGSAAYVVLPYHLLFDWFERQAAGELTAYVFIPLVALGVERVLRQEPGGWILSLGVAGTLLSHLPTALLVAHAFALLVLVQVSLAPGGLSVRLRLFARLFWFALIGLELAAFYWLPAVVLLDTVSPDLLFSPHFEAWRWLYGFGMSSPDPGFSTRILVSFLACVPAVLGSVLVAGKGPLVWISVPAAVVLFLNLSPSAPIWETWIISTVQFPWRMMTIIDFVTGIAIAALVARAVTLYGRLILAAALLGPLVATGYLAATMASGLTGDMPERTHPNWYAATEYLSPEMTAILRNRLGVAVLDRLDQPAMVKTLGDIATEFGAIQDSPTVIDRGPRSLTVQVPEGASVLSLPVQYWFLWRAETARGTDLQIRANARFGTIDILAPASGFDSGRVTLSLPFHPSELAGGGLTLLAVFLLISGMLRRRPRP